jgi:hypothetical protein
MRSLTGLCLALLTVATTPAFAADYAVAPVARRAAGIVDIDRGPNPYCGPRCGCPVVVRVRHRSLGMGYSSSFDPRTRGEPSYFFGPRRVYARYENPLCPERVMAY